MFGNSLQSLKKGESDGALDNRIGELVGRLKELDNQLLKVSKEEQLKYVDLLLEQAEIIYSLEKNVTYRTVNLVEHYKSLLLGLESRRKEADLKMEKFENECNERIKNLKESNVGREEVKLIINELDDAKRSHDEYVDKIKKIEGRMTKVRDKVEAGCREKATDSKTISDNRWN
ncbi:MAG: hypothetical protein ACOCZ6_04350 [Nanoarchaeota archaeon]